MRNAALAVGIGKVRHVDDAADAGHGPGPFPGGAVLRRTEAQAVHAGIQLELDRQRPLGAGQLQHPQLLLAVHGGGQAVLLEQRYILRLEDAFEQQDRALPPRSRSSTASEVEQAKPSAALRPAKTRRMPWP
jgi:hypothetical protein